MTTDLIVQGTPEWDQLVRDTYEAAKAGPIDEQQMERDLIAKVGSEDAAFEVAKDVLRLVFVDLEAALDADDLAAALDEVD